MIGETWQSEIREFKDAKTGRRVRQLTSTGNNYHLYFTENSFDAQQNEIIFLSDRASGEDRAPHEDPHYNLFRMNLDSGEIAQLTDEPKCARQRHQDAGQRLIVYMAGQRRSRSWTPRRGEITIDLRGDGRLQPGLAVHRPQPALRRLLPQRERARAATAPTTPGSRSASTWSRMGASPWPTWTAPAGSMCSRIRTRSGTSSSARTIAPSATFCHEGPWNLVTQRIWLLDFVSREA